MTPVLNRDDAMRKWECRQVGKAAAAQPYPQLEFSGQVDCHVGPDKLGAAASGPRSLPATHLKAVTFV